MKRELLQRYTNTCTTYVHTSFVVLYARSIVRWMSVIMATYSSVMRNSCRVYRSLAERDQYFIVRSSFRRA